jgi:hypothetical protein
MRLSSYKVDELFWGSISSKGFALAPRNPMASLLRGGPGGEAPRQVAGEGEHGGDRHSDAVQPDKNESVRLKAQRGNTASCRREDVTKIKM